MKLKILVVLTCVLMVATVCAASPLTDYASGKTAVDITWRPGLDMKAQSNAPLDVSNDGKRGNLDWGITTGLGGKWAVQYKQFNPETKVYEDQWKYGMDTQELNVLYQLNKNLSAFTGYHRAKATISPISIGANDKNTWQAGLVGVTDIAKNTKLYGVAGYGKDLINYEAGLSYAFAKNTEFNLSYRYVKVSDLTASDWPGDTDITAKGLGYGITFKF